MAETTDTYFSQFWRLRRCFGFGREPSSRLAHCHLLTVSSPLGERVIFSFSTSFKVTNPILRTPLSWPHLTPITSERTHHQNPKRNEFQKDTIPCKATIFWGAIFNLQFIPTSVFFISDIVAFISRSLICIFLCLMYLYLYIFQVQPFLPLLKHLECSHNNSIICVISGLILIFLIFCFLLNLLGWHWLIKLYRFQVYNCMIFFYY